MVALVQNVFRHCFKYSTIHHTKRVFIWGGGVTGGTRFINKKIHIWIYMTNKISMNIFAEEEFKIAWLACASVFNDAHTRTVPQGGSVFSHSFDIVSSRIFLGGKNDDANNLCRDHIYLVAGCGHSFSSNLPPAFSFLQKTRLSHQASIILSEQFGKNLACSPRGFKKTMMDTFCVKEPGLAGVSNESETDLEVLVSDLWCIRAFTIAWYVFLGK